MSHTDSWIGLAEAAQRLSIPYQDAHRLLLVGTLRGEKSGGRWYVRTDDVLALLAKRSAQAAPRSERPRRAAG